MIGSRAGRGPGAWIAVACAWAGASCAGDEIKPPALRATESAVEHPRHLAAAGVAGTTALRLLIDPEGQVDSVEVAQSSGHPGLDSAAVHGARRMTFEPAIRGGRPVSAWVDVPVRFGNSAPAGTETGTAAEDAGAPDAAPQDSSAPPPVGPTR